MADEPRFRIQAVAEMTGVSAHTLRAWERRYGVPRPMRTESTYRLYSQRDVDQIRAIRSLCEQGLSASEAAALSGDPAAAAQRVPAAPDATAHQQVADRLVTATFALDGAEIERLLALATAAGPPHVVLEQVLRPAALRVGELWERGAISVAHEHLFSELVGSTLRDLLRLRQPARPRHRVLLACVASEEHTLGLYGAALHLAEVGFQTTLLGARTPPEAIRAAREAAQPDLIGLSMTVPASAKPARALIRQYANAAGEVPWMVGGSAAPTVRAAVLAEGGHVAPEDPPALVQLAAQLTAARRRPRRPP